MTWRVAHALDQLLDELDDAHPGRSKESDGSIGDAAHASRTSDHNPWLRVAGVGVVRARDFTDDPTAGLVATQLAEQLRQLGLTGRHPALGPGAYVISARRITGGSHGWHQWRTYTGPNPHTEHVHVSVTTNPAGFDSRQPWLTTREQDEAMPTPDELWSQRANLWQPGDEVTSDTMPLRQQLSQARGYAQAAYDHARSTDRQLRQLQRLVAQLLAESRADRPPATRPATRPAKPS